MQSMSKDNTPIIPNPSAKVKPFCKKISFCRTAQKKPPLQNCERTVRREKRTSAVGGTWFVPAMEVHKKEITARDPNHGGDFLKTAFKESVFCKFGFDKLFCTIT